MTIPANADVVVVGAGFAGLSAARELVTARARRRGSRRPRPRRRPLVDHDDRRRTGRPRRHVRRPDPGRRPRAGRRAGLRDGADPQPRQEPDPLAGQGAVVSQHHSAAVDHRVGRRVPDPVAIRPASAGGCRWTSRGRRRSPRSSTPRRSTSGCGTCTPAQSTRDLMAIMARVTWGCEPDAVSMLHAVRYVKAAGGLGRMLDVEGGAQQDRFPGGTQQIALRMAEELGVARGAGRGRAQHRTARRRHPDRQVRSRRRSPRRPSSWRSRPQHRAGIEFDPALPPEYGKLAEHWPQGNLSKAYAAYETPFWRANGCSGEALSDEGPVFITFDVSPERRRTGHLAGLHRCADVRPAAARGAPRARAGRLRHVVRRRRAATRSTTSTIVGAQRNSRPAARPPRCRRGRGRRTGRGCASRSTASIGRAPRPPTSGPASSTARSARAAARRRAEVHRALSGYGRLGAGAPRSPTRSAAAAAC